MNTMNAVCSPSKKRRQRIRRQNKQSNFAPFACILLLLCLLPHTAADDSLPVDDTNATAVPTNGTAPIEISACPNCSPPDAIVYPWFVQLLGIIVQFLLTRFNIPFPYAAFMFILGACMGSGSSLLGNDNALGRSISQWTNIDSNLLLLVFLPGLIFKDAVTIPIHLFLVALLQIWILAFPMVLLGTFLTGIVGFYVLPYDWPWQAAATLGAILASTDPIAVASVLKTAGASPRLVMHISGESLLNDGSSFVFFTIFSQLFYIALGVGDEDTPESISVLDGFVLFFRMSLGGTVVGALFGGGLVFILWELDRRLEREFDILQVAVGLTAAYLCYYVCDQILTMSGVVAVVTLGVTVNYFARGMINDENLMESYLILAEFLLNTLLFTLGGNYLGVNFFRNRAKIGLKSDRKEAAFLAYGGLRGSVGVALGLTLVRHVFEQTEDRDIRELITIVQFMGGGVTLLTLSINGTTAGAVLKLLGLAKPTVSPDREKILFEGMAMDFVYEQIAQLYEESRFRDIRFDILKKYVPFTTAEPPKASSPGRTSALTSYPLQSFNRRLHEAGGAQYLHVVDLTRRQSENGDDAQDKSELLVEMRQIFLEMLREAYNLQLEMKELDMQEDNGFLFESLVASANLASNEVEHSHSTIQDWKWTQKFMFLDNAFGGGASTDFSVTDSAEPPQRVSTWQFSSFNSEASVATKNKLSARRIRQDVIRAIAFQQGHEMARSKLELYINRIEIQARDNNRGALFREVLEQVKQESLEQVKLAGETIEREICKEDLVVVMSYYCARITVRRLMKFTERKAEDSVLGKADARKYLRMMDERVRDIVAAVLDQLMHHDARQSTPLERGIEDVSEELAQGFEEHESV